MDRGLDEPVLPGYLGIVLLPRPPRVLVKPVLKGFAGIGPPGPNGIISGGGIPGIGPAIPLNMSSGPPKPPWKAGFIKGGIPGGGTPISISCPPIPNHDVCD